MTTFNIHVDLSNLMPEGVPITAETFPTLSLAVRQIAEAAHAQWVRYASGSPMPDGRVIMSRSGEYQRSILLHQTGPFSAEVSSTLPYAKIIEEGAPQRDLKKMLRTSFKVRVTKKGKRYLIVPFRWNNPNSLLGHNMPEPVYDWWQQPGRQRSIITSTFRRASGTGAYHAKSRTLYHVPGRSYSWGARLGSGDLKELDVTGKRARHMMGMVAFRDPTVSSGSKSGKYLTFRVMSEDSKPSSWLQPAQEGRWPARTVAQTLQPIAEKAFQAAMQRDIEALLGGNKP